MFPLGLVLFPHGLLPLHVFEPRYLAMMDDIGPHGEFGVTLIERGSEVGGGDHRFGFGTMAKVLDSAELEGGRLAVVAVGTRRFRVERWLPDDPYPRAVTSPVDEVVGDDAASALVERAAQLRLRVLGLAAELGIDVGDTSVELSPDPAAAAWQLCSVSPVGLLDRQGLLECDDPAERLELLCAALDGEVETLRAQLTAG